jgi:hypothetical protein
MLQCLDPLHTKSLHVFHQTGQHPPLLGAEVIAGDVGTMSTQYLDRRPELAVQRGVLQHLEPDLHVHLVRLALHQQQEGVGELGASSGWHHHP